MNHQVECPNSMETFYHEEVNGRKGGVPATCFTNDRCIISPFQWVLVLPKPMADNKWLSFGSLFYCIPVTDPQLDQVVLYCPSKIDSISEGESDYLQDRPDKTM